MRDLRVNVRERPPCHKVTERIPKELQFDTFVAAVVDAETVSLGPGRET